MVMVKCRYANCERMHPSRILPKSEAFLYGKASYYHQDCYHVSKTIQDIKDIFYNKINRNVVMSELGRVINTLVFDREVDPDYIKFAVSYCVDHSRKLQYPGGLFYVISDKDIKREWDRLNAPKFDPDSFADDGAYEIDQPGFIYKPTGSAGFGDILM